MSVSLIIEKTKAGDTKQCESTKALLNDWLATLLIGHGYQETGASTHRIRTAPMSEPEHEMLSGMDTSFTWKVPTLTDVAAAIQPYSF